MKPLMGWTIFGTELGSCDMTPGFRRKEQRGGQRLSHPDDAEVRASRLLHATLDRAALPITEQSGRVGTATARRNGAAP
jgi:hypothetical protein